MKNLALQGEVCHVLPTECTNRRPSKIVSVIHNNDNNTNASYHIGTNNFDNNNNTNNGNVLQQTNINPPVSFVLTSDGTLIALDSFDNKVWIVDLEKVVENSNDEEENGSNENDLRINNNAANNNNAAVSEKKTRSQWFYGASYTNENSIIDIMVDGSRNDNNNILGSVNSNSQNGHYITCLSHAGHIVSVSIDATNAIAASSNNTEEGGSCSNIEDGSECIGSFDNGLECGSWSPDGEVLVLVTFASSNDDDDDEEEEEDNNNIACADMESKAKVPILMTMNTQFDVLAEVHLEPCLIPFHSTTTSDGIDDDDDDDDDHHHLNSISLCWRPDSSTIAVSTMESIIVNINTNINSSNDTTALLRRIRTYDRATLQLLSVSKEEDGAGRDVPNLRPVPPTWAPMGCSHYVGAIQSSRSITPSTTTTTKNRVARQVAMQVAFMEPNGLRHTMCKIHNTTTASASATSDKEDIIGVEFNLEGDLLAVSSRVTSSDNSSTASTTMDKQQQQQQQQYQYGKVQFYHRSNYHWYLKYELRYDYGGIKSKVVTSMKFSSEDPYHIMIALRHQQDGKLEWREYAFRWESSTIHYNNNTTNNNLVSSVLAMTIDGKTLNFTALDKAIIPPPMCASSLELPAPVTGIAIKPIFVDSDPLSSSVVEVGGKNNAVDFIIALSDGKFALLGNGEKHGLSITPGFQPPSILAIVDDPIIQVQGMVLRDITIIDGSDTLLIMVAVYCTHESNVNDYLVEFKVSWLDNNYAESLIMTTLSLPLEGRALRIVNWSDMGISQGARGGALIELIDGSLLEYSQGGILVPCSAGPLLEPCPWIAGIYDAHNSNTTSSTSSINYDEDTSTRLVIGLSARYRLYCGERLLSNASSSFVVSLEHNFLTHLAIGSQPQLKFLPLAGLRDFDPLRGYDDQHATLDGYEPRSVERGARLVAFFPTLPVIVLQLPRGNLESITPRACLLPYIMMKILHGDYLTAFDYMKRQRVDLNLIVDMNPNKFLQGGGAEEFVGQIENIDNINLFLASLVDLDTTVWKYPLPTWINADTSSRESSVQLIETKVNAVCQKMRKVLLDTERDGVTLTGKVVKEGHFLLPVLSTFAKENPPKVEEALSLIKSFTSNDSSRTPYKSKKFDDAIAYLAFLADYEHIYNTAIGMYDFVLAKAVARHSQMDPKVYLPMLKHWRELPDYIARYEVDVKLKRYESALRHLVASNHVDGNVPDEGYFITCLKFIEEHNLYRLGLELFSNEKSMQNPIMVSLGERLLIEKKPREALIMFLAAKPRYLDGGKRASLACDDWRTYFACCAENEEVIGCDQATEIADTLSSKMGSMRYQQENYASAATILLEYADDVSSAIDLLIKGHMWSEGRRVAYLHKRPDLFKSVVDGSYSYARSCIEDLEERASKFVTANERYFEVIVIRREAIRLSEEMGDVHLDDSESMFSTQTTSSINSLRSSASGSSMGSVGSIGTVASVSTVISVGATSTFNFTGDMDAMKHKSKFNRLGRDHIKKKRPKKKSVAERRRMKLGSEEELAQLVETLIHACPDEHYIDVICGTITFLLESGKHSMAKMLFETYEHMKSEISQSQNDRLEQDKKMRAELEKKERQEGGKTDFIQHPREKDVDAIVCNPFDESILNVFSFLP